eukprot:CAMPEP_0115864392 /NCGR_PEP_ID=MMETSP0287-20121206/19179_1 /TAXON_ID=412157 /ORGANISM="Chrysochromulina rotalis, Strain UIO044" /LENGTH=337 /DNA_ID=CAMNT_0003318865 /DNA_START=15 /DNA_END=1025 /DNA_ORIENTATION=+
MTASCLRPTLDAPGQAIVMGMSRSGSSLTTSIVASLFGGSVTAWRGGGSELPADSANPRGYFERRDVVGLNYEAIRVAGQRWYTFPSDFSSSPRVLFSSPDVAMNSGVRTRNASAIFRERASRIVADMNKHTHARGGTPWVLKDVRFARTLPMWRPFLSDRIACIVPYRHPAEVAASSRMSMTDRVAMWQNYMLAALATARTLQCPTMLVAYERWLPRNHTTGVSVASQAQLAELLEFFRCAGFSGLPQSPPTARLAQLIQPSQYHHREQSMPPSIKPRISLSAECLWNELRSARALRWEWNQLRGRFKGLPCTNEALAAASRSNHAAPGVSSWARW